MSVILNFLRRIINKNKIWEELLTKPKETVNTETLLGIYIKDVDALYYFSLPHRTAERTVWYGFDIRELYKHIFIEKYPNCPYTGVRLSEYMCFQIKRRFRTVIKNFRYSELDFSTGLTDAMILKLSLTDLQIVASRHGISLPTAIFDTHSPHVLERMMRLVSELMTWEASELTDTCSWSLVTNFIYQYRSELTTIAMTTLLKLLTNIIQLNGDASHMVFKLNVRMKRLMEHIDVDPMTHVGVSYLENLLGLTPQPQYIRCEAWTYITINERLMRRQCRNTTAHPSGFCYLHRRDNDDENGEDENGEDDDEEENTPMPDPTESTASSAPSMSSVSSAPSTQSANEPPTQARRTE